MKKINYPGRDHFVDFSETVVSTYKKKKYYEKRRYISEIPFKRLGNSLFMTPKPPFAEFKTVWDYVEYLKSRGVKTLITFLTDQELKYSNAPLVAIYEMEFDFIQFPIRDFSTPDDMYDFHKTIYDVRRALKKHSVAAHCFGGNGRTGLFVAGLFIQMGMEAQEAIDFVRSYRPEAIENKDQEDYLHEYELFVNLMEKGNG